MAVRIKLPLITGFRVSGFIPIYSAEIELTMADGPYVILGGNGLGKTTLMQAVVYALAGGLDDKTEEIKALRWSSNYFSGRRVE
jgi:recombinational DNA repair ATPase RecF